MHVTTSRIEWLIRPLMRSFSSYICKGPSYLSYVWKGVVHVESSSFFGVHLYSYFLPTGELKKFRPYSCFARLALSLPLTFWVRRCRLGLIPYFVGFILSLIVELGRLWLYHSRLALSPLDDGFGFVLHFSRDLLYLWLMLLMDLASSSFWRDLLYP